MTDKVDELIAKFLTTKKLTDKERRYLRDNNANTRIEYLATRPEARGQLARELFKLSNILYARKNTHRRDMVATPINTAASTLVKTKTPRVEKIYSGGDLNSTGKKR